MTDSPARHLKTLAERADAKACKSPLAHSTLTEPRSSVILYPIPTDSSVLVTQPRSRVKRTGYAKPSAPLFAAKADFVPSSAAFSLRSVVTKDL